MGLREIALNTVQVYAKRMEPKEAAKFIRYMIAECKKLLRVYDPKLRNKTHNQNAYFHGPVLDFVKEEMEKAAGGERYDKDEVKEFLKNHYGPKVKITIRGSLPGLETPEDVYVPKSIGKYTIGDYNLLIDGAEFFVWHNFNCHLPAPDSDYAKDKMDE